MSLTSMSFFFSFFYLSMFAVYLVTFSGFSSMKQRTPPPTYLNIDTKKDLPASPCVLDKGIPGPCPAQRVQTGDVHDSQFGCSPQCLTLYASLVCSSLLSVRTSPAKPLSFTLMKWREANFVSDTMYRVSIAEANHLLLKSCMSWCIIFNWLCCCCIFDPVCTHFLHSVLLVKSRQWNSESNPRERSAPGVNDDLVKYVNSLFVFLIIWLWRQQKGNLMLNYPLIIPVHGSGQGYCYDFTTQHSMNRRYPYYIDSFKSN